MPKVSTEIAVLLKSLLIFDFTSEQDKLLFTGIIQNLSLSDFKSIGEIIRLFDSEESNFVIHSAILLHLQKTTD